jgi:AcrR family transcriptional regulator
VVEADNRLMREVYRAGPQPPGEALRPLGAHVDIARLLRAGRVIGSTSSQEKAARMVSDLGYDAAVFCGPRSITDQLAEAAPEGQDVAQLLGRHGWAKFTTNEVAEVTGVSIGTLYQYFPNKFALIDAITRRHFDGVLAVLQTMDDDALSLTERVETLVHGMITIHSVNPALHRVLLEEAPSSTALQSAHDAFEAEYLRRYQVLVTAAGGRSDQASDQAAAQGLSAAVAGAIHDAARRGTLATPLLKREIIALAGACLRLRTTIR